MNRINLENWNQNNEFQVCLNLIEFFQTLDLTVELGGDTVA